MELVTETHYRTQPPGTQVARVDGRPGYFVKTHKGTYRDTHTGHEYKPENMAGVARERIRLG